jgi:phosphohistidine phosphatase SixA
MSKLVLVRHGESRGNVWSPANRDDRTNFLSKKGHKQAEIAGMELAQDEFEFKTTISSTMTRACQTLVTIMEQFPGLAHQRIHVTDVRLDECRRKSVSEDHKIGVYAAMNDLIMPALAEGNVLCVTHYFTMQRIFDFLHIKRHEFWCEGRHIPNAMPLVYDQTSPGVYNPKKWVIYNHYYERTQYL